jgi:hypothetical protein
MSTEDPMLMGLEARASNPAGASISLLRFARHYPKWPLLWLVVVTGSALLMWLLSLWFAFLLLPALLHFLIYRERVTGHFRLGDANPGVVVGVNPTLVAIRTDLTKGIGSYPAVRVVRARLRRIMGRPVEVGMRLPTVAVYQQMPHFPTLSPVCIGSRMTAGDASKATASAPLTARPVHTLRPA